MKRTFLCICFLNCLFPALPQDRPETLTTLAQPEQLKQESGFQKIREASITGIKDTVAATKTFMEVIRQAQNSGNHFLAGKAYYEMGNMFFNHKNHNRSFGAYINARSHFNLINAEVEEAYTLFGLGRQQYYRGNYKTAASHLNFAMRAARKYKLRGLEADAMEYLGILYHVMPGTEFQSAELLKKALFLKEKLQDDKGTLRIMEKLGDVYSRQKHYDSALKYLNHSIQLATRLGLYHDADLSKLNRIGVYISLHRMTIAGEDLDKIIAQTNDTNDTNIMIRYYVQKGNYFTSLSSFKEGLLYYQKALEVANALGLPELYGLVYKNMAEAYSAKSMYKEAYEFQQSYNNQIVGFYSENIPVIKELELNMNSNLTRDKLDWLSEENKLKELKLDNEKRMTNILLAGALTFLLLSGVIFYLYKNQKDKNNIIKKQSEELTNLLKEVDHRVKNNLQIISSLLDMQSMNIQDKQAVLAIKEGRNRVQSMALIHQNLYSEGNKSGMAIGNYINNLAFNLFHSYNIHPGQIELKTEIDKLKIDVDTVIPLGLVLNELISNSLKYAFGESGKGVIGITLKKENDVLFLMVKDNGAGFPENMDITKSTSFGMKMIRAFAQKLKADLEVFNDHGACVIMRIRKYKIAA